MAEYSTRLVNGRLCRLRPYLFTCAIEVDVQNHHHQGRYCFESVELARQALQAWDGRGHPAGPWIKFKSATADVLNPAWTITADVRTTR
jgi:hypothetical protein